MIHECLLYERLTIIVRYAANYFKIMVVKFECESLQSNKKYNYSLNTRKYICTSWKSSIARGYRDYVQSTLQNIYVWYPWYPWIISIHLFLVSIHDTHNIIVLFYYCTSCIYHKYIFSKNFTGKSFFSPQRFPSWILYFVIYFSTRLVFSQKTWARVHGLNFIDKYGQLLKLNNYLKFKHSVPYTSLETFSNCKSLWLPTWEGCS